MSVHRYDPSFSGASSQITPEVHGPNRALCISPVTGNVFVSGHTTADPSDGHVYEYAYQAGDGIWDHVATLAVNGAEGIACETVVQHGPPAETLIKLAEKYGVQQIVIGRRGQSGIKTLLFGSVAGNLVQTSPVPVVVVP